MQETLKPKHMREGGGATDAHPWFIRAYGILSVVGGGLQIIATVLAVFGVVDLLRDGLDLSRLAITGHASLTTLIIAAVVAAVSCVLAVMFFVLGIRLLRNNRHRAATLCSIMVALVAVDIVCRFMLVGFSSHLIASTVNLLILCALEVYCDPSLQAERNERLRQQELADKKAQEDGTLGRDATGEGYITLNFFNLFWVFVICCVLGLVLEIIWHMTVVDFGVYQDRAGLLYGPFSPIYGFGAVLMTVALNRYYKSNPIVIFVVAGLIGAAFEYFVSWFLQTAFGIVAWDYSGTFLNINGRTNFMFFCIWGTLGLVWVRFILPIMLKLVNKIPWNWRYGVTTVCAILMIVNGGLTLAAFDCWYRRSAGTMDYEHCSAIVAFCNKHYDDELMKHRFQSMTMNTENAARA